MARSAFGSGFGGSVGIGCGCLFFFVILICLWMGGCLGGCFIVGSAVDEARKRAEEERAKQGAIPEEIPAETTSDQEQATADETTEEDLLTLENYYRIKNGMTYDEVKDIIGPASEENASNVLGEGTEFEVHTSIFSWNGFLKSLNITFQNGRVVSKAQFGLQHGKTHEEETKKSEPLPSREETPPTTTPIVETKPRIKAEELFRTWTDSTGKFTVEAKFLYIVGGKVKLEKKDGRTIALPLEKLSEADKLWIKNRQ